MNSFFDGRRVPVKGACGTVGRELVPQLLEAIRVIELIALDKNESEHLFLGQRFFDHSSESSFLADLHNRDDLSLKM